MLSVVISHTDIFVSSLLIAHDSGEVLAGRQATEDTGAWMAIPSWDTGVVRPFVNLGRESFQAVDNLSNGG